MLLVAKAFSTKASRLVKYTGIGDGEYLIADKDTAISSILMPILKDTTSCIIRILPFYELD